eukprot:scaffold22.g6101.t1
MAEQEEEFNDVDAMGVVAALSTVCELEGRLRQAIQDTHPLTTTLDWDFEAADREREALLAISEQLEYLEDKLREYRFLEDGDSEQKASNTHHRPCTPAGPRDAVLLSQLDSVRRELIQVVHLQARHVQFGKEAVREVLAFASVEDESPREGAAEEGDSEDPSLEPGGAPANPDVLRGGYNRPPRHPGGGKPEAAGQHTPTRPRLPSPGLQSPPGPHVGGSRGRAVAAATHQQQAVAGAQLRRSAEALLPRSAASPRAGASAGGGLPGSAQPTAAATVAALSAATAAAGGGSDGQGRRQAGLGGTAPVRHVHYSYPESTVSSDLEYPPLRAEQPRARANAEPEPPRPGYLAGTRASAAESGRAVAGARAAGAAAGGRILSRMDRSDRRPPAYGGGAPSAARGLRREHEDIFGAVNGAGGSASITNPSPRHYGGMICIQERLARAEEEERSREHAEHLPQRPRIYGEGVSENLSEWDGAGEGGSRGPPRPRARLAKPSSSPQRRRPVIREREEEIDDDTLWKGPSRLDSGPSGASRYASAAHRPGDDGERHGSGLLGRLGRLVVGGAVAVAVGAAAVHAAPAVAEKGQHVVKQLQDAQAGLAAAARTRRQRTRQAAAARAEQRGAHEAAARAEQRRAQEAAAAAAAAARRELPPPRQAARRQQEQRQPRGTDSGKKPQVADMPPWLEGGVGGPAAARPQHLAGSVGSNARRGVKLPAGAAAAAAKNAAERQAAHSRHSPVQHVRAPPQSEAFPARPSPDVSVSMG